MAVLNIRKYPDPILRQKAVFVKDIDGELQRLIDDMVDTLYAAPGIGLAAPQVGRSIRLFVFDLSGRDEGGYPLSVLINPEILHMEDEIRVEEGCLSIPDITEVVGRAGKVTIKGLNREGKEITIEGEGTLARLFQHEMDHLNGKLFIDRLSSLKRNIIMRRLRKVIRSSGGINRDEDTVHGDTGVRPSELRGAKSARR